MSRDSEDQVRDRLLHCARRAFLEHGFADANVSRIAEAAGISKKTVYKHVESKEALLLAVMADALSGPAQRLQTPDPSHDLVTRLESYLLAFAELALSADGVASYSLILREGARFPQIAHTYVNSVHDFGIRPLMIELEAYRDAGQLQFTDSEFAACALLSMVIDDPLRDQMLGIAPPPTTEFLLQRIRHSVQIFLHGTSLRPHPTPAQSS